MIGFRSERRVLQVGTLLVGLAFSQSAIAAQQVSSVDSRADAHASTRALSQKITLSLSHVSLERALDSVARVSKMAIQYHVPTVEAYTAPVSVVATDTPLGIVLEQVLSGTALRVIVDRRGHLAVIEAEGNSTDSVLTTGTILGRVVDSATGRSVNGATVKVVGMKISAVSGDSGRFRLTKVPLGSHAIAVRAFGFRPVDRDVTVTAEPSSVRIALPSAPNVLSGVVTTASGVQERRKIGNDITVLNADSIMQTAPIRTVTDMLEGRVPGLIVQRNSGAPGAPSRVRLRGSGSYILPGSRTMSNDPIVIVDGVRMYARTSTPHDQNLAPGPTGSADGNFPPPSPLDQLDPNVVETIEVFKGPSATSQWGADAGNGVIVITTKRGQSGGRTRLDVSLGQGIEQMPGTYAPPNAFAWGHTGQNGGGTVLCSQLRDGNGVNCSDLDSISHFQALNIPRLSPFGTGTRQNASATLSGGSGTTTYSLTGSVDNTIGYAKMPDLYQDIYHDAFDVRAPAWMRRPDRRKYASGTGTMTFVPAAGLKATIITSVGNEDVQQSQVNQSLPQLAALYLDTLAQQRAPLGAGAGQYYMRGSTSTATSRTDVEGLWNGWNALTVTARAGLGTRNGIDRKTIRYGIPEVNPTGGFITIVDTNGYYGIGRRNERVRSGDFAATVFPTSIVPIALGINTSTTTADDSHGYKDTLRAGVDVPGDLKNVGQDGYSNTTAGWYLEPRFNFSQRFFVMPGFRFDGGNGASGTGLNHGKLSGGILAFFPKLNFAWLAVDPTEQRPILGVVSSLRPRFAFGVAGLQPDPTMNLRVFGDTLRNAGSDPFAIPGLALQTIGNTRLHPERSRELEGGFDAGLWGERVDLKVTMYDRMRTDAILPVPLPASLGSFTYYANVGRVRNRGGDITLANATLIRRPMLTWDLHASYSTNQNRVIKLTDTSVTKALNAAAGDNRIAEGYPLDSRWAKPILGYSDWNHDGRIDFSEVAIGDSAVFLGSSAPKYELPFGTDLTLWKGAIKVSTQFEYKHGITQLNAGSLPTLVNHLLDSATSFGEQAAIWSGAKCSEGVGAIIGEGTSCVRGTKYGFYQTVNVLRFQSFSVAYQVPQSVSRRLRMSSATLLLQGSNLALWTNYRGKDPDVNGDLTTEVISDQGQLPLPRLWMLQLNLHM